MTEFWLLYPQFPEHRPGGCPNVAEIFFFLLNFSLFNPVFSTAWQHPGDSLGSLL